MKKLLYPFVVLALMACGEKQQAPIDREALVDRNSPQVTAFDSLASLSVGNGEFAFTVDATGLQTFPEMYTKGVPLGTQSQWGWHEFTNPKGYRHEETLKDYDFGRGRMEPYSVQFNEDGRQKEAANWFRVNPHRLHLGMVGFEFGRDPLAVAQVTDIKQKLNLWEGVINSSFKLRYRPPVIRKPIWWLPPFDRKRMPASISVSRILQVAIVMMLATGLRMISTLRPLSVRMNNRLY